MNKYLWEVKLSAIFQARVITRRRKAWFRVRMSRILFAAAAIAAKHSWTSTLRMSRPFFIGSYLQVTWGGLSAYEKKEKFASNDNRRNLNVV